MARVNGPPPGRSIYDATPDSQSTDRSKVDTPTVPQAQDVEAVSRAAKDLSSSARVDHQRVDLNDLLSQTSRESSYSEVPAGWPALLTQETSITRPMPDMVLDSQRQMQAACFCGVFNEAELAWASVDNVLFLWDASRLSVPIRWQEEQAICCAGLTMPKPNVFQQSVQYILVVCTTVEIALVGLHINRDGNGNLEMTPINFEHFRIPSDDVMMTTTTCTADGRIFLGGNDGHLYELEYRNRDSWLRGRCNKVCFTGRFEAYLPRWSIFRRASPIVQIAIDRDRQILYTRSQAGAIGLFDMGASGEGPLVKKSELASVHASSDKGQSPAGSNVVLIAPIPPSESLSIHLMAVTADGRRFYLQSFLSSSSAGTGRRTPSGLFSVRQRSPIPAPQHQGQSRSLNITVALYHEGALLLADTISDNNSRVVLVGRDLTMPPVGIGTGPGPGLREYVTVIERPTAGEVLSFGACIQSKPLLPAMDNTIKSELATQHVTPAQHFMVMTTAGATYAHKLRPVDVLEQILREGRGGKLEQFFSLYGAAEASAMCYFLATAKDKNEEIVTKARATLLDTRLTGEATLPANPGSNPHPATHNGGFYMGEVVPEGNKPEWSGGHRGLHLYLQRLLQPTWDAKLVSAASKANPNSLMPNLSQETLQDLASRLRSLCRFLSNYAERKKEQRRKVRAKPTSYFGHSNLGPGFGQVDSRGRPNSAAKRQRLDDPVNQEEDRLREITGLASRASQACFLVSLLISRQLPRLTILLEETWRKKLAGFTLKDVVCSKDGEDTMTQLISVLLDEHQAAPGQDDQSLAGQLQEGCPSYFKEDDKIYYAANAELRRAQTLQGTARQDISRAALEKLVRVAKTVDVANVLPLLAQLGAYDGMVALALAKATAIDPETVAAQQSEAGRQARERRNEECYSPVIQILKYLVHNNLQEGTGAVLNQQGGLPVAAAEEAKAGILRRGAGCKDVFFLEQLLAGLVAARAVPELIKLSQAHGMFSKVQKHLLKAGGLPADVKPSLSVTLPPLVSIDSQQVSSLEMLAKIYIHAEGNDCLEAAAAVFNALATRVNGYGNNNGVSLAKRLELFQLAVMQGQSMGSGSITSAMQTNVQLMDIQIKLVDALTQLQSSGPLPHGAPADLAMRISALQQGPQPLVDLFNQYAAPYHQWELCLQLVHASDGVDMAYVQQLWDLYLKQGYDLPGLQTQEAKCEQVFLRVKHVAESCYPSETALPLDHLVSRLEQLSNGAWPVRQSPLDNYTCVADAMVQACNQEPAIVQQAYDAVLGRSGGDPSNPDVRAPNQRIRILKSLHSVLIERRNELGRQRSYSSYQAFRTKEKQELQEIIQSCQEYKIEAQRLGISDSQQVQQLFDGLQSETQHSLDKARKL